MLIPCSVQYTEKNEICHQIDISRLKSTLNDLIFIVSNFLTAQHHIIGQCHEKLQLEFIFITVYVIKKANSKQNMLIYKLEDLQHCCTV